MKNSSFFVVILSLLLSFLSVDLRAQDPIISGPNLNIGTGNNLDGNGLGRPTGNAIGSNNDVSSRYTLTVGTNDTIDDYSEGSVALGASNYIQGEAAMAFGRAVKVYGGDNIGIGHHIKVNGHSGGMVIGNGFDAANNANAFLVNDSSNSLMVGFNSIKPTLFVSESPNDYSQNILNRTGRVAIGDVVPHAKLHVRSDQGENAGLILETGNPASDTVFIQLRDPQHRITVDGTGLMGITAGINKYLGVTAANFTIDSNLMAMGMTGTQGFTMATKGTPSIGLNAYPSNGNYLRGLSGSSYVMEFSDASFKLRTAVFETPRVDIIANWRDAFTVKTNGAVILNGKVGVNVENTTQDYALAVDGGLITTKVHIQEVGDWQDRVFGEDYRLMPLGEVEAYVAEHRHLPGIPSEAEVRAEGYDVAEMQAALLGKVEELTLHLMRQQREIDSLRTLVTVSFGYDACGNRVSRTLQFSRTDGDGSGKPSDSPDDGADVWQASIADGFSGGEVLLFPNPTEGGFILSLTGTETPKNATAVLCTPDGKVLEERAVTGATEEFDLRNRPVGLYLLRLASEHEAKVWKVIKRN